MTETKQTFDPFAEPEDGYEQLRQELIQEHSYALQAAFNKLALELANCPEDDDDTEGPHIAADDEL